MFCALPVTATRNAQACLTEHLCQYLVLSGFCATFFDTVLDDNALADGLQQTVGTSDQAWSSRGTRKSKGSQQTLGTIRRAQQMWNLQIQQTLGTIRRAQQMWNSQIQGVATNTGHIKTRATDVELANLRGATTAGRYRHTCKMWNLQS